ncbi:DUF2786 domain-containing protein [Salmonella enterica]|nr:DUF2786 domain-containing protein [Salmonella enterica subsp. enterica serovar Sandiego]
MSKIAKLIRSALNNSSANEAAQALKIAASTMQKEGINPAEFLQEKGAEQPQQPDQSAELREAKELAIKWHKVAQSQEEQLKDLAIEAVKNAELEKQHYNRAVEWKNRFIWGAVFTCCAVVIAWAAGCSTGEEHGRELQARYSAPAVVQPLDKAKCLVFKKEGKKNVKVSIVKYNDGVIDVTDPDGEKHHYEKGTIEGINSLSDFTNDLNARAPGNVSCTLGVSE